MAKQKENINLNGKCGGCLWGEPCKFSQRGELSYITCFRPGANWRTPCQQIKSRSQKACKAYKPKSE